MNAIHMVIIIIVITIIVIVITINIVIINIVIIIPLNPFIVVINHIVPHQQRADAVVMGANRNAFLCCPGCSIPAFPSQLVCEIPEA